MRLLVSVAVIGMSALSLACGPIPGEQAHIPAGGVRVVPAAQVKGTCLCDDGDDDDDLAADAPHRRPLEYVKLRDWQPPPQVAELEATLPPRGGEAARFTTFPRLTLHRPIDNTGYRRLGRTSGYLGRGNVHAR